MPPTGAISTQNSAVQLTCGVRYLVSVPLTGLVAADAFYGGWPDEDTLDALSADDAPAGQGQNPQVFIWLGDATPATGGVIGSAGPRSAQGPIAPGSTTLVTLRAVSNWQCPCTFVVLAAGIRAKTLVGAVRSRLLASLGVSTRVLLPDDYETASLPEVWTPDAARFGLGALLTQRGPIHSIPISAVRRIERLDIPYTLAFSEYASEVDTLIQGIALQTHVGTTVVPQFPDPPALP